MYPKFIDTKKISLPSKHLDDLKLFATGEKEIEMLIKTLKNYNDDVGIDFGIAKSVVRVMHNRNMCQ